MNYCGSNTTLALVETPGWGGVYGAFEGQKPRKAPPIHG